MLLMGNLIDIFFAVELGYFVTDFILGRDIKEDTKRLIFLAVNCARSTNFLFK